MTTSSYIKDFRERVKVENDEQSVVLLDKWVSNVEFLYKESGCGWPPLLKIVDGKIELELPDGSTRGDMPYVALSLLTQWALSDLARSLKSAEVIDFKVECDSFHSDIVHDEVQLSTWKVEWYEHVDGKCESRSKRGRVFAGTLDHQYACFNGIDFVCEIMRKELGQ